MNKLLNSISIIATLYAFNASANPTELLFKGIQESDMVMVLDAVNDGANINAPQESGYKNTPLMEAVNTLHNLILNTHNTKRLILSGSILAGIIAGPFAYSKTDKYIADKRLASNTKFAINSASGIAAFTGTTYVCNKLLNRIFTNTSYQKMINAYLIVEILLEQPAINVRVVNPITSQTAHQMVGTFIMQVPSLIPNSHPCGSWHLVHAHDTFLKKLIVMGIVVAIDATVYKFDYSILKEKIDTFFMPIAQQLAEKA